MNLKLNPHLKGLKHIIIHRINSGQGIPIKTCLSDFWIKLIYLKGKLHLLDSCTWTGPFFYQNLEMRLNGFFFLLFGALFYFFFSFLANQSILLHFSCLVPLPVFLYRTRNDFFVGSFLLSPKTVAENQVSKQSFFVLILTTA